MQKVLEYGSASRRLGKTLMGGMVLGLYLQNPFFKQNFKGKETQDTKKKKKGEGDDKAGGDEL